MYPRSSVFIRVFKFSVFVTTCISVYNIVCIVTESKALNTQVTAIRTEEHQRSLRFHYNNILNKSSFLQDPSHLCAKSYIFLIIYVHSAPENAKRRMALRDTWADRSLLEPLTARTVFVMGTVKNATIMDSVGLESERYGDILQGNFLDEYKNLTLKALMSLTWISEKCLHAKYVLKTDDDIVVNIEMLLSQLRTLRSHHYAMDAGLLLCRVWKGMRVIRDANSKWYVSNEEFDKKVFPLYCSGAAFIMSPVVVQKLLLASKHTAFLWVDDVYLTGLVLANAGVKHTRFNQAYAFKNSLDKFTSDLTNSIIFYHCPELRTFFAIWENMRNRQNRIKKLLQIENHRNRKMQYSNRTS